MGSVGYSNYRKRIPTILGTIGDAGNRATVQRYLDEKDANGVKPATLANDANNLRDLGNFLGKKPFEQATREDIFAFVNHKSRTRVWRNAKKDGSISERTAEVRLSENTLGSRKAILRHFYKWLLGDGQDYPEQVRHLKARRPQSDSIPTDELITADDMKALLQAHMHPREKAILAVLYESGLRAGELCALNIGSYHRDEHGGFLLLPKNSPGLKTGARKVRLYPNESLAYLDPWFEVHPRKNEPNAPLFFTMSNRSRGARLTPNALYVFIRKAGEKAGIKKELHPHLFRHSAATERARMGWKESQMRAFFGWTRSSDMPATYVHMSGQDYEDMDMIARGIKTTAAQTTTRGLRPLICKVCRSENLSTAFFCQKCRQPVSPEAEREIEQKRKDDMAEALARLILQSDFVLQDKIAGELTKKARN